MIEGKNWGMDDNRHTLIHLVEEERHWWACTNSKIPSREEDLRLRKLLTEEEVKEYHRKHYEIFWWLHDVKGYENRLIESLEPDTYSEEEELYYFKRPVPIIQRYGGKMENE